MTPNELRQHITNREAEVDGYQVNIDNYTLMLDLIPHDVPERLAPHARTPVAELLGTLPEADLQILSDAQFHARLAGTLIIEKLEQRKAAFVLAALRQRLHTLEAAAHD